MNLNQAERLLERVRGDRHGLTIEEALKNYPVDKYEWIHSDT